MGTWMDKEWMTLPNKMAAKSKTRKFQRIVFAYFMAVVVVC